MNTDRLEALFWARVDGTIEPEELTELEAHLAEHPETREIEGQITAIAEELGSLKRVPPPSELRGKIHNALENATPPAARTNHPPATLHLHTAHSWPARWLPLAASLVIGVAIGYLLHPGTNGLMDQSEVTGTMLTPSAQPVAVPVEIHLDAGAGSVTASRSGRDVVVDVTLATEIDLDLTLAGTGGPVRFESMSSTTGSATGVTTEHGWVMVRAQGPGSVALSANASDADDMLRLQVSVHGSPVQERWIGLSRNEPKP